MSWLTIQEIVAAAQAKLPRALWDYLSGGAESETTLARNRAALAAVIRPWCPIP